MCSYEITFAEWQQQQSHCTAYNGNGSVRSMKQSFRVQLLRSFFCASQRYNALCIDSVVPSISTSGATRNHRTLKCSPNPYLAIVYRYRKIARLQLYHSDWWTQRAAKTLQKHQQPFQLNSVNAAGQHCFLHCFDVLLYGVRVYRSIFAIFCVSVGSFTFRR